MDRRQFIKASAAGGGLALLGSLKLSTPASAAGLYGPLGLPDANGIALPAGFVSRVVATTGTQVAGTGHVWHPNPDGGATFSLTDGGWVYVSNNEASGFTGGVSMVRFSATGAVVDAGPILAGTNRNCAGGPTPWGTWLSCEEFESGRVWECDPLGQTAAVVRPALGVFQHEAAAVDPLTSIVYLTEDRPDSALYRFVPSQANDLSAGELQVMVERVGILSWEPVPDPASIAPPTRDQVVDTKRFNGGEGAWFDSGFLYFTTKGDNRVWRYEPSSNSLDVIYDIGTSANPILSGVDNVTVSATGDVFVCEDGGDMEIVIIDQAGEVNPFLRLAPNGSELTGVAFAPAGDRMYFSSQRNPGVTYEISGPFAMPPLCAGEHATVDLNRGQVPTEGDDVIVGTPGGDVIDGLAGNDVICADAGDDTVIGGPGDDRIFGGPGDDTILGRLGADDLRGQAGADRIDGDSGDDIIRGGGGADTLNGGAGNDTIAGQGGPDIIHGGAGDDTIDGLGAKDTINGGGGDDTISGQNGADTLRGDGGDDTIKGQTGPDIIHGDNGNDTLQGGNGNDTLYGGAGNDDKCAGNLGGNDQAEGATCEQTPGVENVF